jgi:hemerythrin-like domain-containing protein
MTQLMNEPAPDFNDPLGLLMACHQRMLAHCDTLGRIGERLASSGVDEDVRDAARQVHRYFATAAKLHHQDEEQDFFPMLVRTSLKIAETIHDLKQDHRRMEALWQQLDPLLTGIDKLESPAQFTTTATEFAQLYRSHIEQENEFILSTARHLLSAQQLSKLGRAMADRRQVRSRES